MARNAAIAAHLAEHAEIEAPEPVHKLDRPIVLGLQHQIGVGPADDESDDQDPWAAPNHQCVVCSAEVCACQDPPAINWEHADPIELAGPIGGGIDTSFGAP